LKVRKQSGIYKRKDHDFISHLKLAGRFDHLEHKLKVNMDFNVVLAFSITSFCTMVSRPRNLYFIIG